MAVVSEGDDEVKRIVDAILRFRSDLTREDIERMIREKVKEFGGIIRRDAAAVMVAKELGVPISREAAPPSLTTLRVKDLASGFRGVDIEGIVIYNSGLRVASTGRRFFRFAVADDTGVIWGVAWDEQADKYCEAMKIGSRVRLSKVSVKRYRERNEIIFEKNSSLKVISEFEPLSLVKYLEKYLPETSVIRVVKSVKEGGKVCLLGLDSLCRPTIAVFRRRAEFSQETGSVAVISGCTEASVKGVTLIRCSENSPVTFVEDPVSFGTANCDEQGRSEIFGVKAEVMGYVLFRREGGRVLLNVLEGLKEQRGETVPLLLFHDAPLKMFSEGIGRLHKIYGAVYSEGALRETECLHSELLGAAEQPKYVFSKFLSGEGFILNRAMITGLSVRVKCVDDKPLFHVLLSLDDGTTSIRGLSNDPKVFAKIVSMEPQEACEYPQSTLEMIVQFSTQETVGREAIVKVKIPRGLSDAPAIIKELSLL